MLVRIFIVLMFLLVPSSLSYAQMVVVEAEGTYMVGDGPNENINLAKELARRDALRNASERAGVYVQSYSKTTNNVLTADEVMVVSASILQIVNQECVPVVEGTHIKFVYRIKANVDVDNLRQQIDRVISNSVAFKKSVALEERIATLEQENSALKKNYIEATADSQKELYQKLILQNEKSMVNTLRYTERLPKCEMTIGSIPLGCTLDYVKKIYGKPDKVTYFTGDGVKVTNYFYGNTVRVMGRVFARWDSVEKKLYSTVPEKDYPVVGVIINDGSLTMPCGIKVGDSYIKIVEKFGLGDRYEPYNHPELIGYSYMLRATGEGMRFEVDKNGIICEMASFVEL